MIIRPLQEQELSQADHVFRLAFGTAAQLSNPLQMFGDAGYMQRWYLKTGGAMFPTGAGEAIAAEKDNKIIGSIFLVRWGSLGLLGPLTVHPDDWNQGIASKLMSATMEQFEQWQTPAITFFTSSHSSKHLWFYSKFGFSPGYLTKELLTACNDFAAKHQLKTVTAGVNTSRHRAYWQMLAQGFKIRLIGVAMHQAPHQDYCRSDVYVLDDRR